MDDAAILIPIICSLGLFTLIGTIWVSWINAGRARARLDAEVRGRLLERTAPTDPRLLRDLADAESRLLARDHVLRSVRWASILIVLGGAFSFLARVEGSDFMTAGLLMMSAGVGFAAATLISLWLCKGWGVLRSGNGEAG